MLPLCYDFSNELGDNRIDANTGSHQLQILFFRVLQA